MSKLPPNSSATPYDSVSFRKVGWETFEIPLKRASRLSEAIEKEILWTQGLPDARHKLQYFYGLRVIHPRV